MKNVFTSIAVTMLSLSFIFSLTSCAESHYYHHYNHHTRGWYERRHTPPPPGVNFEVDVDVHHRH